MKVKINLHSHERIGSFDSTTPQIAMTSAYNALGYDAVGFVGHDDMADVESEQLIIFNGIEREVSISPETHIVEFPEIGFSFLAHPERSNYSKEEIQSIINEYNLDGVEKFSDGVKQYRGEMPAIELSNDDAHNVWQIGTSFMEIEVNDVNRGQIVQAIKRGDIELKNNRRRVVGQAVKSFNSALGSAIHGR